LTKSVMKPPGGGFVVTLGALEGLLVALDPAGSVEHAVTPVATATSMAVIAILRRTFMTLMSPRFCVDSAVARA
jgi:hypothetical protein